MDMGCIQARVRGHRTDAIGVVLTDLRPAIGMETFTLLEQTVQTNNDIDVFLHHMDLNEFNYI